ncbi:MAG: glycosyltransferase [Rhodospirillales bacterium]|nr:glycosyltransferase [Rhodospirillales bacterium]
MHRDRTLFAPDDRQRIDSITQVYRLLLGRNPDQDGLRDFVNALRAGAPITDVIRAVLAGAEFQARLKTVPKHDALRAFVQDASLLGLASFCTRQADVDRVDVLSLLENRDLQDPDIYRWWIDEYERPRAEILSGLATPPTIRLALMLSAAGPNSRLQDTLGSIRHQGYPDLQVLVLTPHSGSDLHEIAEGFAALDPRIHHVQAAPDESQAELLMRAWTACKADFVGQLSCGDLLAKTAATELALACSPHPAHDVLSADSDTIDADGARRNPCFWGGWDRDQVFAGHLPAFVLYGSSLIERLGGWREVANDMEWLDLGIRAAATVSRDTTCHVPRVLYHRRQDASDCAPDLKALCVLVEQATGHTGLAMDEPRPSVVRVVYPRPAQPPLASIVIPTTGRPNLLMPCLESIRRKTRYPNLEVLLVSHESQQAKIKPLCNSMHELPLRLVTYDGPFNWGRANNIGAAAAQGSVLTLLNDDTEALDEGWLDELVRQSLRPDVGAVGAKLVYPDGRLQHAGMTLSADGGSYHVMRYANPDDPVHLGRLHHVREVSAVTGACLAVRSDVFRLVGGIEQDMLTVECSDVDFCLRVSERGYRVIWTPYAWLMHKERTTRGSDDTPDTKLQRLQERLYLRRRWLERLEREPFWSPNLALSEKVEAAVPPRWTRKR